MVLRKNMKYRPGPVKPPVEATEEYTEKFLEERKETLNKHMNLVKISKDDKQYLLDAFEMLIQKHLDRGIEDKLVKPNMRYTPRQMFDCCVQYMRSALGSGQPLTITGMGLFMGLHRKQIWLLLGDAEVTLKKWPEFDFLFDFASFVEMYNEYAAHKKQNPAGPIFILKNFGWKDKFEIEASSTQGALTDEEREIAQRRIANFSEN